MYRINYSLILGLLTIPFVTQGGGDNSSLGARSFGLAHASVTIEDEWALFNNIAGINRLEKPSAILAYQNLYGIPSLNRLGAGIAHRYKKVVCGISFYKLGNTYYNEIKAGAGAAHRIRNVSLGIKLNYHQISIQEIGIKRNIILEFGGIAELSKHLLFGAHIYNLNQAKVSKERKEYIPVILKAGLSYLPFEKLLITLETEKQLELKTIFKTGIEYSVIEKLKLRTGISLNPSLISFGAGFKDKKISIDYALNTHSVLGVSQQLSLTYIFKKKNEK